MEVYIDIPKFNPHPGQSKIITNKQRFNVVKCGRRFGKTEMSKELATELLTEDNKYVRVKSSTEFIIKIYNVFLYLFIILNLN